MPQNPYIPTNFSLLPPGVEKYPSKISSNDSYEVWYLQDNEFADNKVHISIKFHTADFSYGRSAETEVLTHFWKKIFKDQHREHSYLASQGGCTSTLKAVPSGVVFQACGYA